VRINGVCFWSDNNGGQERDRDGLGFEGRLKVREEVIYYI